jgi:hypothetical protein
VRISALTRGLGNHHPGDITGRGHFDLETVKVKFQNLGKIWKGIEKVALIGDAK